MKIRPLPETDLANIAALPVSRRRERLEGVKLTWAPYSYDPVRKCLPDIFNEQPALLGSLPASEWAPTEKKIRAIAEPGAEAEANVGVGKPLHGYIVAAKMFGRPLTIGSMVLGLGGVTLKYWAPTYLVDGDTTIIPFLDFRRHGLSPAGRLIACSLMRQQISLRAPDLLESRLAVFQFTDAEKRRVVVRFVDAVELLEFDELQQRLEETYKLWFDVLEGREEEAHRATGKKGDLL